MENREIQEEINFRLLCANEDMKKLLPQRENVDDCAWVMFAWELFILEKA